MNIKDIFDALLNDPQKHRLMRLSFPKNDGPAAVMMANQLDGHEGMSRDFVYTVEVLSRDPAIPLKDVLGRMVTIELEREDGSKRYFNGYVFEFSRTGSDAGISTYQMELRPWLAFLKYRRDNYLFHGKTVHDQTAEIFADYPSQDWRTEALGNDVSMTDACQFDETDYNYVHRRWEAQGWSYWYEHRADGHTLVLTHDSTACKPIDGATCDIPWRNKEGFSQDDGIYELLPVRQVASTQVATSSFDFKSPRAITTSIPTQNQQGPIPALEVYDYAGAYGVKNAADADGYVKLRMEQIEAGAKTFIAKGDDRTAQPGRWFRLTDHAELGSMLGETTDVEFLIVNVHHHIRNNYEMSGAGAEYANHFECLRKHIPWRPAIGFSSTHPRIYGVQTAVVVGPKGEEIHTDPYGRVRVQFHWDREGQYNENSSAWVRVASTWAGSNFGFMAVPRIGQEVIVQWLDGNPDRPLITGRVYNENNMPPWDLPANQTQTGILSRSSQGGGYDNANALRFEDKKGAEEVWLHAEKDQRIEVENDESHWVGHDRSKTIDHDETVHVKHDRTETVDNNETITIGVDRTENVGNNETITIGVNRTETVGANETITIGANRTENVGSDETITIGGNRSVTISGLKSETISLAKTETIGLGKAETIGLGKALTIGAAYQTTVGGLMNTTVGLSQSEQVGISKSISVGQEFSSTAGTSYEITAGKASNIKMDADSITLSVGDSSITLKKSGDIIIAGKSIQIAGSDSITLSSPNIHNN